MPTSARVELTNSRHDLPEGSLRKRRTNSNRWLELTLGVRRLKELPNLSNLDAALPASRRYLTREQLASEYGSDPAAVEKIETFAKTHGLVVTKNERGSARLGLAGTVESLSTAFGVQLFDYENAKLGQFHARTGPVYVPSELGDSITGVFGFNNHRILRRLRHTRTASAAAARSSSFLPADLAKIYKFPAADVSSQCIALLEFGGGVVQSDIDTYFPQTGVPKPTVTIMAIDGVSTDPNADKETTPEVMLDIEVAGAIAVGAKLAVYFSTFDEKGLIDALSAVISDSINDPSVVSISYGWDENQPFNGRIIWSPAAIDHINQSFLAAAQLGITVCVSTGDDGSEAQVNDGRAHVNFPATSPYVLAVGGTTLHVRADTSAQNKITEVVWNNGPGSGGTGGGVSDYTPVPAWQAGVVQPSVNPGGFAGRGIPDVAANADPNTGYQVMVFGANVVYGGTSASSPLWASLIARINALIGARTGNFNALLYSKFGPAGVLRDIKIGNNDVEGMLGGAYPAGPGWDACTGWGVPDGQKLLDALGGGKGGGKA